MAVAPNSLQARDVAYAVHPYTNLRQHERQGPLAITGGEGVWVQDDDGGRYIEGLAGLWCTGLGFSQPRLGRRGTCLRFTAKFASSSFAMSQSYGQPILQASNVILDTDASEVWLRVPRAA